MSMADEIRFREDHRKDRGLPVREVIRKIKKEELLRLLLEGFTTREAAAALKCGVDSVRRFIREGTFQDELRALSETVWRRVDEELLLTKLSYAQRIEDLGDRALAKMAELLDSDDERVVARVASDVLDRNPDTSKHHKVENKSTVMIIQPEQLAQAAKAALEIDAPRVIEGTISE